MKGLYQKVVRGSYPPLPSVYSSDLSAIVKQLLQVNPTNRPTCSKILAMTSIHNHLSETLVNQMDSLAEEVKESTVSLLDTIKVPRNLGLISERLPKANYNSNPSSL